MNKYFHRQRIISGFCLVLSLSSLWMCRVYADTPQNINSTLIAADTLAGLPACLHYEIQGTCFWLTSTGTTITTLYVQHYLPDVVVSAFSQAEDNPWLEIHDTLDQAGQVAENSLVSSIAGVPAAGGQHSFQNPLEQNVFFKQVDILGNPGLTVLPSTPALLPSVAIPLMPYFQSMLDSTLWRGFPPLAVPEQTYAYGANITHYVGSGASIWGGAYPYEGKTFAGNDAKAASVIAERASNLLTATDGWGHLYRPLPTQCGIECQAAVIQENDDQTQFQLIYPTVDTTCQVFGKSSTYGENVVVQAHGAYVWVLWRRYRGCIPAPGCTYIQKILVF